MKEDNKSNWAEWAIKHRQIVYFFSVLVLVMGIFSFKTLGRSEGPQLYRKANGGICSLARCQCQGRRNAFDQHFGEANPKRSSD